MFKIDAKYMQRPSKLATPVPVRSQKLSKEGPVQYMDG